MLVRNVIFEADKRCVTKYADPKYTLEANLLCVSLLYWCGTTYRKPSPTPTPQACCIGMDDLPKIVFPLLSSIFYSFLEKNHNISYKMDCVGQKEHPPYRKVLDG